MTPKTKRIVLNGMLAALYVVLTMLSLRAGNLRITLGSLPVVTAALLLGPADAVCVAMIGEALNQLLSYGLTMTTPLWMLPPMLRGLLIALAARHAAKTGSPLEQRPAACYAVCLAAAVLTTVVNTGAIWLDAVLYGYYSFAYVFGTAAVRFVTGMVTAVLVTSLCIPLVRILKKRMQP